MTHGWRPNSVTIHPSSIARNDNGPASTIPKSMTRFVGTVRFFKKYRNQDNSATNNAKKPLATIPSDDLWIGNGFGRSAGAKASSPLMVEFGLNVARILNPSGISRA